jgi:hypothetical protein
LLVVNLSSTALGHVFAIKVEARVIASHCCGVIMTLARNVIQPCNNFVEPLHQLLFDFALLGFEAHEV